MLTLRNVYAGYDGVDVIKDVSLSIKGSVSIVGPNGCGKTTLLKVISNIMPYRGEIEINGKPFNKMKRRDAAKHIAMLSQQAGIYFTYSVFDTVMMGRYLHIKDRFTGNPGKYDRDVVMESLHAVNLYHEKDRLITTLSGGQLQRVFLAKALAQEPNIILLDEPTNHLDLKCQIEITDYLIKWAGSERAVVGVMHDLNLALRVSEKMIVMYGGKISAFKKTGEIIESGLLNDVFEMDVGGYMRSSLAVWV